MSATECDVTLPAPILDARAVAVRDYLAATGTTVPVRIDVLAEAIGAPLKTLSNGFFRRRAEALLGVRSIRLGKRRALHFLLPDNGR